MCLLTFTNEPSAQAANDSSPVPPASFSDECEQSNDPWNDWVDLWNFSDLIVIY